MAKHLFGTLVADRGYIRKDLSDWLKEQYGITLLTGIKKRYETQTIHERAEKAAQKTWFYRNN